MPSSNGLNLLKRNSKAFFFSLFRKSAVKKIMLIVYDFVICIGNIKMKRKKNSESSPVLNLKCFSYISDVAYALANTSADCSDLLAIRIDKKEKNRVGRRRRRRRILLVDDKQHTKQ